MHFYTHSDRHASRAKEQPLLYSASTLQQQVSKHNATYNREAPQTQYARIRDVCIKEVAKDTPAGCQDLPRAAKPQGGAKPQSTAQETCSAQQDREVPALNHALISFYDTNANPDPSAERPQHTLRTPLKPDLFLKAVLVRCMFPSSALSPCCCLADLATACTCTEYACLPTTSIVTHAATIQVQVPARALQPVLGGKCHMF